MDIVKKRFIRICINAGCLSLNRVDEILLTLCKTYKIDKPEDIKIFVQHINKDLNQYNQKLEFYKHPLAEGDEFLVFAATFETEASKQQMHYTESDRYYFLKLMEAAVSDEDYGITWLNVYNIVDTSQSGDKKLSKQRMQILVDKWTKQGYYLEKGEKLYLGPRLLVEFENHLKINYAESLDICPLCSKLVMWDVKCSECQVKLHRTCIRTYLIRQSSCPSCNKTWNTRLSRSQ